MTVRLMRTGERVMLVFIAVAAVFFGLCVNSAQAAVITSPADYSTVELLSPGLKTYNTAASTYQAATYRTKNTDARKVLMADVKTNDLPVVLGWTGLSGVCSVRVYRVRDGENAQPVFAKDGVAESSVAFDYAEVGRNYRWTVTDGTTTLTGHFYTRLTAPRIFRQINNYSSPQHNYLLGNCRDLGGWTNTAGKVVRQGLFFRCEEWDFLDGVKDESGVEHLIYDHYDRKYAPDAKRFWCDTMGVSLDVDLRAKADVMKSYMPDPAYEPGADIHNSPISYDLVNRPIRRFYCDDLMGSGFPSYQNLNSSVGNRLAFYHTFTNFVASARTGRALIFHCSQGKDRTGSLAYVVNGLLGVPRHDLDLDWIYSWAEDSSITLGSTWSIDLVYNNVVGKYAGATLADKCAAYVTQCYADAGEPSSRAAADIADFRARMLEEPETPADIPADRTVWLGKPGDFTTAANWSAGVPSSVLPGEFPMLSTNEVTLGGVTELDASTLNFGALSETVFSGEGGVSSRAAGDYLLLGPGATLVARNGAGADGAVTSLDFAVAADSRKTASALIGDGARLVAENGGTIAVDGALAADAGCVAFVARGASSGPKSQVAFAPLDNLAKGNTNVVLKAEGNARVLIRTLRKDGDTWNPGKGLSGAMPTVTVIERSGGSVDCSNTYVEGARLKIDAEDGALISFDGLPTLADGSDIRLSNTTLRVAWNEANFGANETTIALRGDTPAITVYPYDDDGIARLSLRKKLTVTLAPTPEWCGAQGRFLQPNAKHGRTVVESGVKFVVDVSALAGQTGSRTFRIVETKNDDKSYTALNAPAADSVSVTGVGADTATVAFAVTGDRKCLDMTVTFPAQTFPTVDGEPVDSAAVFTKANSQKPTIVYPDETVTVRGMPPAQTISYGGTTVDVPAYYTATKSGPRVTIDFNENAKPVIADDESCAEAISVGETSVSIHIGNAFSTLYYRLRKATDLHGDWMPIGVFEKAKADFTASRAASESAAFYKVDVTDVPPGK